ncbi:MAG TPA: cysteine--1-D-myo-inosityl 2-amino-2-deoxy-alpha-D-glucopyranoside ligase [Dermatophilaceae bacterium]|nr:cysteine--1-D-myo-inosityl 2-amino-2-deoxy-alpha-D-glucopyranoside ligase [Dermatophilaceae bacterium]
MKSWPAPAIPALPGRGIPLRLHDTASGTVRPVAPGPVARMYVCGITPYDATHLGHAATYVTFDVVNRVLRDGGHGVRYVQNTTDVDDPLLERAARDGVDWRALAAEQLDLYREDMTALGVIPPDPFVGVVESMDPIAQAVRRLLAAGAAYRLPVPPGEAGAAEETGAAGEARETGEAGEPPGDDVYFDLASAPTFGTVSGWTRAHMLEKAAERGGDPERPGKRDPLDPLLWRAARPGEPSWPDEVLGAGRPGWHVECTVICVHHLGTAVDVKGGGSDLVFPHHEMSAAQASVLTGGDLFARLWAHQGMVGYRGEKMSKSQGNLVLVSRLRAQGVDPAVVRMVLLEHHYRSDWDFTEAQLESAADRLACWRAALSLAGAPPADLLLDRVREALADDLDTPRALALVDDWATAAVRRGGRDAEAPGLVSRMVDALLGVRL